VYAEPTSVSSAPPPQDAEVKPEQAHERDSMAFRIVCLSIPCRS